MRTLVIFVTFRDISACKILMQRGSPGTGKRSAKGAARGLRCRAQRLWQDAQKPVPPRDRPGRSLHPYTWMPGHARWQRRHPRHRERSSRQTASGYVSAPEGQAATHARHWPQGRASAGAFTGGCERLGAKRWPNSLSPAMAVTPRQVSCPQGNTPGASQPWAEITAMAVGSGPGRVPLRHRLAAAGPVPWVRRADLSPPVGSAKVLTHE